MKIVDATAGPALGSIAAVLDGSGPCVDARRNGATAGATAMPFPCLRRASATIVLIVLILALPFFGLGAAPVVSAQGGLPTQVVPDCDPAQQTCNTYEFSGDWVVNPDANMLGSGGMFALTHQALAETSFTYMETPWVTNHIPDNEALIQNFALVLLSGIGQISPAPVATGTLDDGTSWHVYTVSANGSNYGALVTADTSDPSQNDIVTLLTSPASTFDQAVAAVQSDIRINGVSPLAGIDPAQLMTALGGGAGNTPVTEVTSTPGNTPTAVPSITTASTAAIPGAQFDQSLSVGSDTVTYNSPAWQNDPTNTTADIATFQPTDNATVNFGYAQGPDRTSGGDVQLALTIVDPPTSFGAQNDQQIESAVLPSGRAYALYTWEREGASEVALFVLDVTTTPGTLRVQFLFAPPEQFVASLTSAQQSFQINGENAFSELDPRTLAASLGGVTTAPTAPALAPTTGPSPTSSSGAFTDAPRAHMTPIPATTPVAATTQTPVTSNVPVVVADATISYGGTWSYDSENSTPNQLAYFDNDALGWGFFGYRPIADSTGDVQSALSTFDESYLTNIGAINPQLVTEELLPNGQAWALYTLDYVGLPVAFLSYADVPKTPGQLPIQWIFTGVPEFSATLTDAQINVQINGVPAFSGLDPATVSALLAG
jgi:hypothetical protein